MPENRADVPLDLQFSIEDVFNAIAPFRDERIERRRLGELRHDLISPASTIIYTLDGFLRQREDETPDTRVEIANRVMARIHAYGTATTKLVNGAKDVSDEDLAQRYRDTLSGLAGEFPLRYGMQRTGHLHAKERRAIDHVDVAAGILVYSANRKFSPNFVRKEYLFATDMKDAARSISEILEPEQIRLSLGELHAIETKADYCLNAVEPIIWNAFEHAFGWGRHRRLGHDGQEAVIIVEGRHLPEEKTYLIEVRDNGVGISEGVNVFDGRSTKRDESTPHGIGLRQVRRFVESYGGTIDAVSIPHRQTIFSIMIHYNRIHGGIAKQ